MTPRIARGLLLVVPVLWAPLVYGPLFYFARNSNPPLTARFLLDPIVVFPLVAAGVAGYIASDLYWSPAVPAVVESVVVLLTPVAMEGVSDSGPYLTYYMLLSFYWLAVGLTCFFVAKRIPPRDALQKRYPGPFGAWDDDDE